jgi:hypothetical protein
MITRVLALSVAAIMLAGCTVGTRGISIKDPRDLSWDDILHPIRTEMALYRQDPDGTVRVPDFGFGLFADRPESFMVGEKLEGCDFID